jgi:hypothetical protein
MSSDAWYRRVRWWQWALVLVVLYVVVTIIGSNTLVPR